MVMTFVLLVFGGAAWFIGYLMGQDRQIRREQTKRPSIYSPRW